MCGYKTGRIYVFAPSGGDPAEYIEFEDPEITNVCFGGPAYRTLFVTESGLGRITSTEWKRPGMILFPDRS